MRRRAQWGVAQSVHYDPVSLGGHAIRRWLGSDEDCAGGVKGNWVEELFCRIKERISVNVDYYK